MKKVRVSVAYHRMKIDALDVFATGVKSGIYNNSNVFITPPGTEAGLEAKIADFLSKRSAYKSGGPAQEPAYTHALNTLMAALDELADYVNSVAEGNESVIQLSGFKATKGSASSQPKPGQPGGIIIRRGAAGVLSVECARQNYADSYLCIVTVGAPPPPQLSITVSGQLYSIDTNGMNLPQGVIFDFTKKRKKEFAGLVSGTRYYFTYVAINATGVSALSDPTSAICG